MFTELCSFAEELATWDSNNCNRRDASAEITLCSKYNNCHGCLDIQLTSLLVTERHPTRLKQICSRWFGTCLLCCENQQGLGVDLFESHMGVLIVFINKQSHDFCSLVVTRSAVRKGETMKFENRSILALSSCLKAAIWSLCLLRLLLFLMMRLKSEYIY